jgi:ATP-dependent Clp protease adaptor protein ClpS
MSQADPKQKGDLQVLEKPKTARPHLYEVLLHNDDYTTMEFVVYVLMKFFRHGAEEAHRIMLHVHQGGVGVAGLYPFEVAETKVHQVTEFAHQNEMPLKTTMRRQ